MVEVSSFQLEAAGCFRPKVGVLLNITPDHLIEAKRIYRMKRTFDLDFCENRDLPEMIGLTFLS